MRVSGRPSVDLDVQLRLVADRDVGLAGGDQFGRVVRVGRSDDLDVQAGILEIAELVGDDDRCVIRIDEPVEQQGELLGGRSGPRQAQAEQDQEHHRAHGRGSREVMAGRGSRLSGAHGIAHTSSRSTAT